MEPQSMSLAVESTSNSRTRDIFNDNLSVSSLPTQDVHTTFPQFSRLLPELRLYIWKLCLPPRRMISIRISQPRIPRGTVGGHGGGDDDDDGASAPSSYYTTRNSLGNIVSSYPYRVHVPRFEQWSRALELVNRESRQAFSSFYRIAIPIYQADGAQGALLRLNPDTDILEVQLEQITRAPALMAFFHDAVANDPVGRGIAHLALGRNINDIPQLAELTSLAKSEGSSSSGIGRNQDRPFSPHDLPLHPVAAASMRQWLQKGLRTFYSVISPSIEARNMLGIHSWQGDGGKYHQNRSIPISAQARNAQVTEYSSVGPDPRRIEEVDLAHVAVGLDPRRNVHSWQRVLANLGVDDLAGSKSVPQVRYLLAIWPDKWSAAPVSREGFVRFLEEADARFAKHMMNFKQPPWGNRIDEEAWRRKHRTLSDVAGLWVFGADTFGEIPSLEESAESLAWRPKLVKDLSPTKAELLVFHLA